MQNVSYGFGHGNDVINDFSFKALQGQWVTFKGPSGSGKTTLLNLIAGHYLPRSGSIQVGHSSLRELTDLEREKLRLANMSFIFQDAKLIPEWTVLENVLMPQILSGVPKDIAMASAIESLDRLGIARLKHRSVLELSGGEAQRVGIARAVVKKPLILLADEPTGNLDQENTRIIVKLLNDIRMELKTCVICVTHDEYVASAGDQVITVDQWQ